jgi:hypothetical protein
MVREHSLSKLASGHKSSFKKRQEEVMYDQVQINMARLNPASRFKHPMEVVEAMDIPIGEKLTILKAWEADERALQRAEDEGMGGGEHAHLHSVHEALGRLEGGGVSGSHGIHDII